MESILEGIAAGISRGREAIDFRMRLRSAQPNHSEYEEPSVIVTQAPSVLRDETQEPVSSVLQSLANRSEWSALIARCQSHPLEAMSTAVDGRTGDTVLHCAVEKNPPRVVIKELVAVDSESVTVFNHSWRLPLHVACAHRASSELIQELIEANPRTASVRDGAGFCPLHILCDRGSSISSLWQVLQCEDGVASVAMEDCVFGRTPLHILNQRKNLTSFACILADLRECRKREKDAKLYGNWTKVDGQKLTQRINEAREMEFWSKARLLIHAEYGLSCKTVGKRMGLGLDGERRPSIVQACLGIQNCPLSLLEYALLVYNEDLMVENRDGDLPLHQACASSKGLKEKDRILTEVLLAEPRAAQVRSKGGFLPLELYLHTSSEPPSWSETLQSLISAYPMALEALDFDVRLYPLLLSRMGCTDKARSDIFDILRGNPTLFFRNSRV